MQTTLYLVRHAQSQPGAHVPDAEWPLSERGGAQAEALVPILAALGIERVYTSPFRRCRETLRPFTRATGLELRDHDGLRERCLGTKWLGDFRDVWTRSWQDFSFAVDGGESSWVCQARVVEAVADIAALHAGETIAIGSHGNAIGLFLNTIDPTFGIVEASALRTPEIVKVVPTPSGYRWERTFSAGDAFDRVATHFRQTPGIVA